MVNGVARNRIARPNANGSADFTDNAGADNTARFRLLRSPVSNEFFAPSPV
jgi:hypothetical protein